MFKAFQEWLSRKGADLANLQQRRNRAIEQLVEMLRTDRKSVV